MNELVTNSIKYALSDQESGYIKINIEEDNQQLIINYTDSGVGLNKDFDLQDGGFGFKLINILCQQLHSTIDYRKENKSSIIYN